MAEAMISPQVLRWARERAQIPASVLIEKISKKVPLWEAGEAKPTFLQAQKLAKLLHIPFGYLFLNEPPEEVMPLPDLRTIGDIVPGEISVDLREVINDAKNKQAWFKEYAVDQGMEPVAIVGRFAGNNEPEEVARDIARTLNISDALRASVSNWKEFLSTLIERTEKAGVLVMHSGIVGNNTHRPLNVSEFRGFAISDSYAPLVFLNWKDAEAARIFTLIHELAHLWLGESGISDVALTTRPGDIAMDIERFCNAVAAEVLVPANNFLERWNHQLSLSDNAHELVRHYRVSSVVIGRRAFELGLIQWQDYVDFYQNESRLWRKSASSGGNFYLTVRTRLGMRFASAVIASVTQGRLLYRDAGYLLGVKPSGIKALSREMGL